MKVLLLVSLLIAAVSAGNPAIGTNVVVQAASIGGTDVIRAVQVDYFPVVNPRVIDIKGIEVARNNNTAVVNAARFIINTLSDVAIFFQYFTAAAQIPNGTPDGTVQAAAATFALLVKNLAVFEFVDGNGINGFQQGSTDNVTGYYLLFSPDLQWKPVSYNSTTVTVNGNTFNVRWLTYETLDRVFFIRFIVADVPVIINGKRISSNRMKVDVGIRWFENVDHVKSTWGTGPSNDPNAQVGLFTIAAAFIKAAGISITATNTTQQGSVAFATGGFNAALEYATDADTTKNAFAVSAKASVSAQVVDTTVAFNVTAIQGWAIKYIWFTFNGVTRPAEVFWDPSVGGDAAQATPTSAGQATSAGPINAASKTYGALFAVIMLVVSMML